MLTYEFFSEFFQVLVFSTKKDLLYLEQQPKQKKRMKKFDTITAILVLIAFGFFIYHTAITEDVSRQVFWGILLLLNYIKGTKEEIQEKIVNQNKDEKNINY